MRPLLFATSLILLLVFTGCSSKDSCENTICLNGGICSNGVCDCPDRFTGPSCETQALPDKIILLSVSVTRFPATHDGALWDATDNPDIFFRLYDEEGPLAQPLSVIENADPLKPHIFSIQSMDLFNVRHTYRLKLLDYEGPGILSEDMGILDFKLYQDDNGFPETIVVDDGGPLAFRIQVQYIHADS